VYLEITVSMALEEPDLLVEVLGLIKETGVSIAIDDFGTGFSSLQYLNRFPVDRLKIAQDFIRDLATGSGNAAIVRATIGLARELGLHVIAEGVETAEQFEQLKGWGCREIQGYYFSKPLPVDLAEEALRKGRLDPPSSRPSSSSSSGPRALPPVGPVSLTPSG
jgi:EAL domain-containing protein (putative c-di-GMP-specific phosphodiesterase class I)